MGLNDTKPAPKGKQFNPFSITNPIYAPRGGKLNSSKQIIVKSDVTPDAGEDETEDEGPGVSGKYVSEEFEQCMDIEELKSLLNPKQVDNINNRDNNIVDLNDVAQTCEDLAIDG